MEVLTLLSQVGLDYALLLFVRVLSMTLSSPIFGRQNIPSIVRISFSLAITYFFFVFMPPLSAVSYSNIWMFVVLCILETVIGLIMGWILTLFFTIVYTAGQMIDMQMGFGMANVLDPQTGVSVPMIGGFLNIMIMLVFLSVGGMERLIAIFRLSLQHIPIGGVVFSADTVIVVGELFVLAFLLGVQMALPIVASGLLGEAIMGMILRTVPQMNMFVIGLPLKVILGFLMLLFVVPVYVEFTDGLFDAMFEGMERVFATLVA